MTMLAPVRNAWNRLTGGGREFSVTVPVMDGPLKPNDALEAAALLASLPGAGNLVARGDELLFSRGSELWAWSGGALRQEAAFDAPVTALAVSPAGEIAVGLSGQGVALLSGGATRRIAAGRCITALAFLPDGALAIANGSEQVEPNRWTHDLMAHGASGSVSVLAPGAEKPAMLARGLRFPSGICAIDGDPSRLAVTEAWSHRLIEAPSGDVLLDHLPFYPARLILRAGGYLLATYSVRSQLIEFILREARFLRRMRTEVAPEYWIAPALRSGASFKEPLQSGGVIRLGIHKPWAPTRSYGLVVGLDGAFQPLWSAHSRADGARHGVTSVAETPEGIVALSEGNGDLVLLAKDAS